MNTSQTQPVTTQTTSSSPWSGAQPYLSSMYQAAEDWRNQGVGYQPYTGATMAPLEQSITNALGGINTTANQQYNFLSPQVQTLSNTVLGQAQGLPTQVQGALTGLGQTASQYGDIYNQALGATNPYLLASIADQNARGNAAIQSSMSAAGRYGSGQYQDVMARAQAQVADPLLMQDYEARQNRALQASQGLGQTYGQVAGIAQQGLGQAAQLVPSLEQTQYSPLQMMLSGGQYMQDYNQQVLQGQIALYNAQQAYPWQQLQRESAILSGAGTLGGTQVTQQTPLQQSLMSRLAGGALVGGGLGSTIGGPIGAAGGAGLGALAGAFL